MPVVVSYRAFINTDGVGTRDIQVATSHHLHSFNDADPLAGNELVLATADWFRDLLAGVLLPTSVIMKIIASKTYDQFSNKLPSKKSRKFSYEMVGTNNYGPGVDPVQPAAAYVRMAIEKRVGEGRSGHFFLSGALDLRDLVANGEQFNVVGAVPTAINAHFAAIGLPPVPDVLIGRPGVAPTPVTGYIFDRVVSRQVDRRNISYLQARKALAKRRVREIARAIETLNPDGGPVNTLPPVVQQTIAALQAEFSTLVTEYGPWLIEFARTNIRAAIRFYLGI